MPVEVRVPEMGESVVDATVGRWMKQVGEPVQRGEILLELETEKVNLEIAAEADGVVEEILVNEGETVNVGAVLARIGEGEGKAPASAEKAQPAEAPAEEPKEAPARETAAAAAGGTATGRAGEGTISPAARRLAEEHDIDLGQVTGSGRNGIITKDDVARLLEERQATPVEAPAQTPSEPAPVKAARPQVSEDQAAREERIRMSRRRQTIARRLVEAQQTAAMLTTFNEIDMSAVMALRARQRERFKERHGVGLGYMSFFTKAVIGALKAFPNLNAEIDGDEIVRKRYYNIGIAIGVEAGLVVPVLRDADRMSFAGIEQAIVDLSERARTNKLTLEELSGGTFTITNGGIFGSLMSTPILNTPEVGILGMHKIQERAVVVDGQVVARPMMYVALSYDHRIVDGREAVQFLVRVKELIEEPASLLLDA